MEKEQLKKMIISYIGLPPISSLFSTYDLIIDNEGPVFAFESETKEMSVNQTIFEQLIPEQRSFFIRQSIETKKR